MLKTLKNLLAGQPLGQSQPQPHSFDEGAAAFQECQWTEAEMVAWINEQDPYNQRRCWETIARCKREGLNSLRVICNWREKLEAALAEEAAEEAANAPAWYETWFDMRMGWFLGGLFNGDSKLK